MTQEGIDFVTNTEIGKDITADELKEQYDAVILCTGAQKQRDLLIEGREAKGVHFAMDYLTGTIKSMLDSNFKDKQFINTKNKDVIVIGGEIPEQTALQRPCAKKREASSSSANIRSCPIQEPPKICGLNSRMSIHWTMLMKRRKQHSAAIRDNIRSKRKS